MKTGLKIKLDLGPGEQARDLGISLVLAHTPAEYKQMVWQAAFQLIQMPTAFTVEAVRNIAGDPPNHVNALPALWFGVVKSGLVKKVGHTKAKRKSAHARNLPVYVGAQFEIW